MNTTNDLALSTVAVVDAPLKMYLSAAHALGCWISMRILIEGCPALDYERLGMLVQSSPDQENPHIEKMSEIWLLEDAFKKAETRSTEHQWESWVLHRMENKTLRSFKRPRTTVKREIAAVDGFIEEYHAEHDRMVKSKANLRLVS